MFFVLGLGTLRGPVVSSIMVFIGSKLSRVSKKQSRVPRQTGKAFKADQASNGPGTAQFSIASDSGYRSGQNRGFDKGENFGGFQRARVGLTQYVGFCVESDGNAVRARTKRISGVYPLHSNRPGRARTCDPLLRSSHENQAG
jgi:hypothetical protein